MERYLRIWERDFEKFEIKYTWPRYFCFLQYVEEESIDVAFIKVPTTTSDTELTFMIHGWKIADEISVRIGTACWVRQTEYDV